MTTSDYEELHQKTLDFLEFLRMQKKGVLTRYDTLTDPLVRFVGWGSLFDTVTQASGSMTAAQRAAIAPFLQFHEGRDSGQLPSEIKKLADVPFAERMLGAQGSVNLACGIAVPVRLWTDTTPFLEETAAAVAILADAARLQIKRADNAALAFLSAFRETIIPYEHTVLTPSGIELLQQTSIRSKDIYVMTVQPLIDYVLRAHKLKRPPVWRKGELVPDEDSAHDHWSDRLFRPKRRAPDTPYLYLREAFRPDYVGSVPRTDLFKQRLDEIRGLLEYTQNLFIRIREEGKTDA